jgi:uncharacterized damage-inducible protein DinB
MIRRIVLASSLSLALPLLAADAPKAAAPANPAGAGMAAVYSNIQGTLAKAAEKMPEENYSFKPTPEVRSFGQIVGHVADAQNMICKMAMGEQAAYSPDVEKGKTSKADLVAALKESSERCAKVFQQSNDDLAKPVKLFGMDMNRYAAATVVVGHAFEHYGNLVTYMRIKGIVPPTSEPRQAPPAKEGEKKDEGKKGN